MSLSSFTENLEYNSITDFYNGANIFLTGATGFVGKTLLEKLLRSCRSIGKIYLLIKPKKGINPEQRLKTLLESPVFIKLKDSSLNLFEKVKVLEGNISEHNLGLNEEDRRVIREEVNIVFHLAATVRFDGDFKETVMLNVFGTKEIIKLCEELHQLKGFVYVSTAFSNADKKDIEEVVYDPPYEPEDIIKCVQTLPSHILEKIVPELIGKHPNVYTFSKVLAESIVSEHSVKIPAAIVRPSIINSSWKEPFPGWVDGLGGITGIIISLGLGAVNDLYIGKNTISDLIPVDIVVNTIISAPWYNTKKRSSTIKVYNCVSGPINKLTHQTLLDKTIKYAREYPTQYAVSYPYGIIRENVTSFLLRYFLYRYTFAIIYDAFLYCTNHKPVVVRLYKQTKKQLTLCSRFATFQKYKFHIKTFKNLMEAIKNDKDGDCFDIDMSRDSGFDWNTYVKDYILGVRKYMLKDNSDLNQARAKLNRVYWINKIIKTAIVLGLLKIGMGIW